MRCRILLLITFVFLTTASAARAQGSLSEERDTKACNHIGYDLWDFLKVLPVRFVDSDPEIGRWKYEDAHTIRTGSFVLHDAEYVSRENKKVNLAYVMRHKGSDWLCYYCSHCNALLRAFEL